MNETIAYLLGALLEQAQNVCEKSGMPDERDIAELRRRGKAYHAALRSAGSAKVTLTAEVMGQQVS